MTAEIGIFNKTCVVLAADSAITVSHRSGRKVLNTANKIFNISKHHPIGLMIYNSAQFAGIPWEIIVKEYRKELGRKSFQTVTEYLEDFIAFLHKNKSWVRQEFQDYAPTFFSQFALGTIFQEIESENLAFTWEVIEDKMDALMVERASAPICDEFHDYKIDDFKASHLATIRTAALDYCGADLLPSDMQLDKLASLTYDVIVKKGFPEAYSGLFFAGFGHGQIFPSYQGCEIGFVIDGRIRKEVFPVQDIDSLSTTSSIVPLAQTEVAHTFLKGIDPRIEYGLLDSLDSSLVELNSWINNRFNPNHDKQLSDEVLQLLWKVKGEVSRTIELDKKERHTQPVIDAVSHLSKEDLIELAESIIGLTSLKQRISLKEESVGGPVDIAVITKGDGFVWIKRKHYFSRDLNENYFANKYLDYEST